MGDHYTPRKYLLGFCDPAASGHLWAYDKLTKRHFRTTVGNVAHENGFYSPEDEAELNRCVEMPANPVLDNLRSGKPITAEDRIKLALYIATFIYRVPHKRELFARGAPEVFEESLEKFRGFLEQASAAGAIKLEVLQYRMGELDAVRKKYAGDPALLIQEQLRSPWPCEEVCELIFRMNWRLLRSSGPSYFMTSDNPAFFFSSMGLGKPESELSFPLSTELLLHGCWHHGSVQCQHFDAKQKCVKEINRRTASSSTRFLFYHKQESWVAQLGDKNPDGHLLNRIPW